MSYAPIVTWTAEGGHRLATEAEAAPVLFLERNLVGGAPVFHADGKLVRRLSYSDPCDQRMIWYFAAIARCYSAAEAITATVLHRHLGAPAWGLFLQVDALRTSTPFSRPPPLAWIHDLGEAVGIAAATEALCAAVWGTK